MNTAASSMIVVTGVDGILRCAETGSCRDALAALRWLATYDVPVVMTAHSSAADVVRFQTEVGLRHPFVADGGATAFIPLHYFPGMRTVGAQVSDWQRMDFAAYPGDTTPALEFLLAQYRAARGGDMLVIGCAGDRRDRPVLELADVQIIVRPSAAVPAQAAVDEDPESLLRSWPAAYVTSASGPAGWSEAILGGVAA
jgi:predicted mannosyl-3-phosphoglycerate phosphatase (HAD superfamily)